jgi:hypothetical protein
VKFRTRRFRGNVMDVAAKSVATSPMSLSAAIECDVANHFSLARQACSIR